MRSERGMIGGVARELSLSIVTGALILGSACTGGTPDCPVDFTPKALENPEPGFVWNGFDMRWNYNHRWSMVGGGLLPIFPGSDARNPSTDILLGLAAAGFSNPATAGEFPSMSALGFAKFGTGDDTATEHVGFDVVHSKYTRFAYSNVLVPLIGKEFGGPGDEVHNDPSRPGVITKTVVARFAAPLDYPTKGAVYLAALNGFWLDQQRDAMKVDFLDVAIDNSNLTVIPSTTGGRPEIQVPITVSFRGDCDTSECKGCLADDWLTASPEPDNVDLKYDLHLSVVVVAGSTFGMVITDRQTSTTGTWPGTTGCRNFSLTPTDAQCWIPKVKAGFGTDCRFDKLALLDPNDSHSPMPIPKTFDGLFKPTSCIDPFEAAFATISRFKIDLDGPGGAAHGEHHMLELRLGKEVDAGASAYSYDKVNGRLGFNTFDSFQTWDHAMTDCIASGTCDSKSKTAYSEPGSFKIDIEYKIAQIHGGFSNPVTPTVAVLPAFQDMAARIVTGVAR